MNLNFYLNKATIYQRQAHPYHVMDISPWPFLVSLAVLQLALSVIYYFNAKSSIILLLSLLQLAFFLIHWFTDIITESTFEGNHTSAVQRNIRFAFGLFILSEVMFFFGFFWSYLHYSLSPSIWIGCVWPPAYIEVISYKKLPLLNTVLLIASGVMVTTSHKCLVIGDFRRVTHYLLMSILLGLGFVFCQWLEYNYAQFTISDSVYGSIFYLMTGFHGIHVIVGLIFLFSCYLRFLRWHFTTQHHVGYECAIWYWHFVDVVWLFLYLIVYFYN